MCLHFDARFSFERLDFCGGVLFPEARRNGRFEIFFSQRAEPEWLTADFQRISRSSFVSVSKRTSNKANP